MHGIEVWVGRLGALLVLCCGVGCLGVAGEAGFERGDDDDVVYEEVTGPTGFGLGIDTSGAETYATLSETSLRIEGRTFSSVGIDRVESGPDDGPTILPDPDRIDVTAAVERGPNLLQLRAFDTDGNMVHGNRSLLRANYAPPNTMDPDAIVLGLDQSTLDMLSTIARDLILAELNISDLWGPGEVLVRELGFTVKADRLTFHEPIVAITHEHNEDGSGFLLAHLVIPSVRAGVDIDTPVSGVDLEGHVQGNINVWVGIWPLPGADGCIEGFGTGPVTVQFDGFDADLHVDTSIGGIFDSLASAATNALSDFAPVRGVLKDLITDLLQGAVEPAVQDQLGSLDLMSVDETIPFLAHELQLQMCITGMDLGGDTAQILLGARVGSDAPALFSAPGVPQLPTTHAPTGLQLDPALLSQLLYAGWEAGGLQMLDAAEDLESTVRGFVSALPGFRLAYDGVIAPTDRFVVDIRVNQAPIVLAGGSRHPGGMSGDSLPASEADMTVAMGDVEILIRAGDEELLKFHGHAELAVAISIVDGVLVPTVVPDASHLTIALTQSGIPLPARNIASLEGTLSGLFASQLGALLAELELELPGLGGLPLPLGDIRPTEGGMLAVDLAL